MDQTISYGPESINVDAGPLTATLVGRMASLTPEELTLYVFEVVRDEILSADASFTPRSNLVDAGVDSLALTQILLSIEERTGFWMDEGLLTPESLESVESLSALVHEHLSSA
jgi:acyl carrier protein